MKVYSNSVIHLKEIVFSDAPGDCCSLSPRPLYNGAWWPGHFINCKVCINYRTPIGEHKYE